MATKEGEKKPRSLGNPWNGAQLVPELPGGLEGDGGGQRTEVGRPYDGEGEVQRGVEKRQHRDAKVRPRRARRP